MSTEIVAGAKVTFANVTRKACVFYQAESSFAFIAFSSIFTVIAIGNVTKLAYSLVLDKACFTICTRSTIVKAGITIHHL